jgi:hypothetical protein
VESFSSDKYRLLESVFSWDEELAFLASQPGYGPDIGHRHRNIKRKLACDWISELQGEFEELFQKTLSLLANSEVDRPDLHKTLWRLKFTFTVRSALLRLRLRWDLPVLNDVQQLTITFERLIGYSLIINQDLPATGN